MAAVPRSRSATQARAWPLLVVILLFLATLVGCASTRVVSVDYPRAIRYDAAPDSVGLAAFLDLPASEQSARRQAARGLLATARQAEPLDLRLRSLANAVGLAPDYADAWLALIEQSRWFADLQTATRQVAGLREALTAVRASERDRIMGEAALTMAWINYERGEWFKGLAWVDTADACGNGGAETVRGLLLAGSGQFLYAEDIARVIAGRDSFDNDVLWITSVAQWYRGNPALARTIATGGGGSGLGGTAQSGPDAFVPGELRPEPAHAAACWRDLGMLEEVLGNTANARTDYRRARAAIPGTAGQVVEVQHVPLDAARRRSRQPVWLAFDRFYVTGSLSAYTALAYERLQRATTPAEREFWAGASLNGAGTCMRRQLDEPWALRVRGLVMLQAGRDREGRDDLRRAWRAMRDRGREDYTTASTLAHLELADGRAEAALPLARAAVRMRPDAARCWADLGLALDPHRGYRSGRSGDRPRAGTRPRARGSLVQSRPHAPACAGLGCGRRRVRARGRPGSHRPGDRPDAAAGPPQTRTGQAGALAARPLDRFADFDHLTRRFPLRADGVCSNSACGPSAGRPRVATLAASADRPFDPQAACRETSW